MLAPAGESQPSVEVDLFASTSKVKILNADSQDVIMEHPLRSLSYIADIGDILVLIAKRKVINCVLLSECVFKLNSI